MRFKRDRVLRTLIATAALTTILGAANVLFGTSKISHYEVVLSKASAELATPEEITKTPFFDQSLSLDRQQAYINRIRARIAFYGFVVLGGKTFLAISGALLLGALIRLGLLPPPQPRE